MTVMIDVKNLTKTFTLHNQGGVHFSVLSGISFVVNAGECVALHGSSGSGKSTLLRSLYANYKPQTGHIKVASTNSRADDGADGGADDGADRNAIDIVQASPREILQLRQDTIGYVSQFLRVIPRVSSLAVVMEPLRQRGVSEDAAQKKAAELLERLNIPSHLWHLAPSTFSGGEQQRINIARGFIAPYPILLLDEPTASLDATNRAVVLELMREAKQRGAALVGIFHDEEVRDAIANRLITMLEH